MVLLFRGAERWKLEGEMTRVMKCSSGPTATGVDLSRPFLGGSQGYRMAKGRGDKLTG